MQVILTHEQADFDAVASLLGATLLHKDALAVLPNNLNRNVRSFVHLYDAELPFIPVSDLPNKKITDIILVDTQSLVTIKGITKNTRIHVIDHHPKKADLHPEWMFQKVETGSCTTFFVEQLQEINGNLNLIQATLLLLGIYEDSGSLTYSNTTPEDLIAAAYLLENGASLKIAAHFLNPPLSLQQRQVFDLLLKNMASFKKNGCTVIISYADAPELEDEVSSIAHKIVDFFDPEGLFIFANTHEGIRLVARSTTDQIDVAEITSFYNGGGHSKAAAALIKKENLKSEILSDFVKTFQKDVKKYIKPAITVKQIMSKKPLTIGPQTTAKEAFDLMQRFGYEGYPVIEKDQVLGLLIRRAVDRSLAHKMNLSASSLMEAGNYSVYPDDSLDELQQVMADSGWGQIPVVDPVSRQVIGIVTRTDLLKNLADREIRKMKHSNLSEQMEFLLPASRIRLLKTISAAAKELNLPIYLVGGFARDLILKKPSLDMDFVVEGDAIQLAEALSNKFGGQFTCHKKFGTATWRIVESNLKVMDSQLNEKDIMNVHLPDSVDLISARTEYYEKPTALPTVKKGSIKLDLHRRDFTINTLAIRLDGSHFGDLYDYWGGLNDLKKKKVRVLHSLSFVDDPTRLLRAIRFEQRFGFSIESRTLELMREAKGLLLDVSGDRIRHELDPILEEPKAVEMFVRMDELGLLQEIHPKFQWNPPIYEDLKTYFTKKIPDEWKILEVHLLSSLKKTGAYLILLGRIERNDLKKIIHRLRFIRQLEEMLLSTNELWFELDDIKDMTPSQISRKLDKFPPIVVYCVYLMTKNPDMRDILLKYATKWKWMAPYTDGNVLKSMGLAPGPIFGEILGALRDAWINGKVTSEIEEKRYLEKLIRQKSISSEK